jgi:CRISPR-associated endoribonuclease Cas6
MLIALKLMLTPTASGHLPPHLGRAVYAAALTRLATLDPALAETIHRGDGPKPLICSGLLGLPSNGFVTPGHAYAVRLTGLTPAVGEALRTAFLSDPPAQIELDGRAMQVTGAVCDAAVDGWTGQADYPALAARYLAQAAPPAAPLPRTVTLDFASPTTFKSGGVHIPVPLPALVFGSLVERWNAFSPIALSPDARRFGAEMVAISRYHLRSAAVGHKGEGLRIGGMGRVTYHALGGDRYWLGVMHLLAAFALYSGVGAQTTTGMGQARCLADGW